MNLFQLDGPKIKKRISNPIRFINDRYSIFQFVFWFILQPIYIIIIGIGSFFQNHIAWKGEKIK